jgi:hypothetical protein
VNESLSPQRRFLRDLILLLGLPAILTAVLLAWWQPWRTLAEPFEVSGSGDVFSVAAGTWDWEGAEGFCQKDPHTVSFSPDRTLMTLTSREPYTDSSGVVHQVTEYDIQEQSRGRIRALIRGETRKTAQGVPVVWDLVLVDSNTYRWHRTDWPLGGSTKSIRRCLAASERP